MDAYMHGDRKPTAFMSSDEAFCSVVVGTTLLLLAICPWTCPFFGFTSTDIHGRP
jgi:hypothetical protein